MDEPSLPGAGELDPRDVAIYQVNLRAFSDQGFNGVTARLDQIELEIGAYLTVVTDHQKETAAAIAGPLGLDPEVLLAGPHNLIGSVDYICEELQRRRELYGISYITVLDDGQNDMVRQFAPVVARLSGK